MVRERLVVPKSTLVAVTALAVITALLVEPAFAQNGSVLTNLENHVATAARGWQGTVLNAARSLFWILATIEVGIAAAWLAIQAPSLEAWFAELVRRILFIGFFLFVLQKGPDFAKAIVDSLFQLGASGGSASPADVFNAGVNVAAKLSENAKFGVFQDNTLAMASVFAMIVVVITFALVAAIFVAAMVEMYVGLLAGMIMLGLGGSSFTKDFAIRYLIYAFSVGMKLMGLVMIARIGSEALIGMANDASSQDQFLATLTVAGISVVVFMIAIYVPSIIQGVVQGVSVSNGMEAVRAGSQAAGFGMTGAGVAIGAAGIVQGSRAAAAAASAAGASRSQAALTGIQAAGGALGSAAAEKLMGAPSAKGASTLGLANAKLIQKNSSGSGTGT